MQPPPSPTGYRAEFESKAEELLNWLDNSAEILELITMDKRRALEASGQTQVLGRHIISPHSEKNDGVDVDDGDDDAIRVIDRVTKELEDWRHIKQRILLLGEQYRDELSQAGENIEELDQLFDEIEERWTYLDKLLIEANRQMRISNQSVEFQQEAAKIHALLTRSKEDELLKLKNEEDLKEIPESKLFTNEMKSQSGNESEIDIANINERFEDIKLLIVQVKDVISQPITIGHPEDADEQLATLNKMVKDFEATSEFLANWEINSANHLELSSSSPSSSVKWNETLKDLREQYKTVCANLNTRIDFLQDLSEQHELFLNQFEGIEKWLADMTDYLDSVSRAHLPSVPVIQAQLQESCEALNDMKTLKPTLQKVDEVAHRLLEYFSPAYAELTTNRLQSLHNDWNEVRNLTKSNRDHLRAKLAEANSSTMISRNQEFPGTTILSNLSSSATTLINTHVTCKNDSADRLITNNNTSTTNNNNNTPLSTSTTEFSTTGSSTILSPTTTPSTIATVSNAVQVDIAKLEVWMHQSKEQLSQFSIINDPNDLKKLENVIKVISDKIIENRPILAAIDTCSAVSITGQPILDTEALLTKAHFADLESAVAAERERLMAAIYHLDDFKTVLNSEKRWFETVRTNNERVKNSNYSEISEITDDLESLDRLSREHTIDDEERLNKLANALHESCVMGSAVMKELEMYKTELTLVKVEIDSTTAYLQSLLDQLRSVDERVMEIETSLLNIEDDLDNYFFNTQSTGDISVLTDKLQARIKSANNLIKDLDEMIEYNSLHSYTDCLTNRLESYKAQLQERVEPLSKILPQLSNPSVHQSKLNKLNMELKQIENKLCRLDVISVDPEDIKAAVSSGRTMLATLNELKTDLLNIMDSEESLYTNEKLNNECLSMLSEKHNQLVLQILSGLERLDKALPLIEELEQLMSQINENLLSVEEVTDYLETADCPVSRKDLIQKIYLQLTHLCQENGTVAQIRQVANKLKLLTPEDKPELTAELFNEIEDHLHRVIMAKEIFQSQMDEVEKDTKCNELLENSINQLKLRNIHTPELIDKLTADVYSNPTIKKSSGDYLLSINRLIDNLLKSDAQISPTLQNLAREIRIHFNGIINFNCYCLGTSGQLSLSQTDSCNDDYQYCSDNMVLETSISERKTLLQLFAQQRLYLEARLRDLIVTGGNTNSSDRLEDLLNLQSLWYETNEKLDKKFHKATLLEEQLSTAQQLLIDYTKTPTTEIYNQCIKLLTELEQTYHWKLTLDKERLKYKDYLDMNYIDLRNKFITDDYIILNDELLNIYEKQLQCTNRLLNCIQNDLKCCHDGLTSQLGAYIDTLESELQTCNKSLMDSAKILQEINDYIKLKRKSQTNQIHSENSENINVLEQDNDEIVWLKVLLSTQKNRLDTYNNEFELNKNDWLKRYQLWQSFNERLRDLKMTTNHLLKLQDEDNQIELSNIENKIKDTCIEFASLRQHSSKLISMNSTRVKTPVKQYSLPSSTGISSIITSSTFTGELDSIATSSKSSNDENELTTEDIYNNDKPPTVPPRRHSLYRGHTIQSIEHDHEFVRYELNRLENELLSLCRKYGTLNYVTQPMADKKTSNTTIYPEKLVSELNPSQQITNKSLSNENNTDQNNKNNKPFNQVFPVKEVPVNFEHSSTSTVTNGKEVNDQTVQSDDIRTCLTGLNESIDWFIHESCLVPVNISEYIDSGKKLDDYFMNDRFWCIKSQTNQSSSSNDTDNIRIEVNNNYVQSKLKELHELIDSLPKRSTKIKLYQKECEALIKQFPTEDTSRIRADMEQTIKRWNELEKSIKKTKTLYLHEALPQVHDHFKEQQTKLKDRRTSSSDGIRKPTLNEQLEMIENKFNQISKLEAELNQSGSNMDNQLLIEKRAHLVTESQTLQAEINMIATQIASSAKSSAQALNVLPNQEFFRRLRQLRDKIANLRRTMQLNSNQSHLYLTKLKKLNDWLSHRDAAFHEILVPIQGDMGNVISLREKLLGLFQELNTNRLQIEEILCHHNTQHDNVNQNKLNVSNERETEIDSDLSDSGCKNNIEDSNLRTNRRITRHLYHLKKKWLNLNNNMLDFKCQLDGIWERLSNFNSLLNDAVAQVKSAESVTLKWIPIEFLPSEHIKTELDQTKSFYEACEPLAHSLDSLERQVLQLQEIQVQIEPKLRVQLNCIRNEFERIRVITQTRIHQLNQSLSALQMMPQRPKYQTVTRNSSQRTQGSRHEAIEPVDQTIPATSGQLKNVPLHDSVRLPWERCVHPSGTQVPYYKNHETQETQWDHPILCDLMKSMKQFNTVRFSDYRTGLKLRRLQKELCFDSISISIVAESLKHIGHSQTLSNPILGQQTTDPFDRMITVPQIIDYLLQLFNHTRTLYGLNNHNQKSTTDSSYGHNSGVDVDSLKVNESCLNNIHGSNSNLKDHINEPYSTLPGSRPSDCELKSSTIESQNHSRNCMGSFLRSSSTTRPNKSILFSSPSTEPENSRKLTKTPVRDPGCHTIENENTLSEDNRSSSLPVCTIMQVNNYNNNKDMNSINRGRRNTMRRRKHYLIGSIKRPVNVCVDLILNWLLNVYDRMRCGTIRVLSFKVALALMSMANLDEKYRYLFSLISDRDGCVDEQRLGALLYECVLIPRNLGETGQFGNEDFNQYVKTCFQQVLEISKHSDKIDGTLTYHSKPTARIVHFLTWLRLNPQMLTWLPLLHRLALSEQVIHHIRCSVCHNQPLIGLRYRCLRCLNFDMCQQCFFAGRTSRNHKLTHPMQEYCSHSTSTDSFKDFTRIVRNRFRSRDRLNDENERRKINNTNGQKVRRSSTSRTRCKRNSLNSFDEDKPRPAPTYSQDPFSDFAEYQNLDTPFVNDQKCPYRNSISNTQSAQHYFLNETSNNYNNNNNNNQHPIPSCRPLSNVAMPSNQYSMPPRASSDTQSSIFKLSTTNTKYFTTYTTNKLHDLT
ncbi:unnamed protein product [Schistosoma margrebowiei]|uniref:Uncharacterized protein n=1 Tax=Schistosoma margrebowiei TaxID=48269 RepID=A0AA84Z821_9TREM|nr:unnamed protein product [Schistosoma margrebowiei]